jgi:16S rRNA (guanine527-N7)-methyltransferase
MASAIAATLGAGPPVGMVLDLGAGGGLPGLVLAELWPVAQFVLLDANRRRTDFLRDTVATLGWLDRVGVVCERAEIAGRDPELRSRFDLVIARGFGPPATTAECAAPFLTAGGYLAVSEPPVPVAGTLSEDADGVKEAKGAGRWPDDGCAQLGLRPLPRAEGPVALQVLRQTGPCPDRYPRRNGIPGKRPLF